MGVFSSKPKESWLEKSRKQRAARERAIANYANYNNDYINNRGFGRKRRHRRRGSKRSSKRRGCRRPYRKPYRRSSKSRSIRRRRRSRR